jgi:hypothetical protein
MIPKVVYTLNGVSKTVVFNGDEFTNLHQAWERDEVEYKNPFTGDITRKCRGYYYTATLSFDGVVYDLMDNYRDILNSTITDLTFFPNIDSSESYAVDANQTFEHDDADAAHAHLQFELVFRGKVRKETPLNYPVQYWGARHTTFAEIGMNTFEYYSQE